MSIPIPNTEPTTITAGDTITWKRSEPCFPALVWTLTYRLYPKFGTGAVIEITASNDNDDHLVNESAAISALWTAEDYIWYLIASDGSIETTLGSGSITIKPDPRVVTGIDNRTHARKALTAVETAIENLISKQFSSVSVEGTTYTLQDIGKLYKMRSIYSAEVRAEENAELIRQGKKSNRNILTRFTNPI